MKRQGNQRHKKVERKQNLDRRAKIYLRALDLFIQKGYSGTSVSMIAKASGMSKANLYHYCFSKEDLFYKIHLDYLKKHLIPIIEEAEQLSDPRDRIASILKRLALLNATDKATRVLVPDIINLSRSHHKEIISIWRRAYDVVCSSVKELKRSGRTAKFRESFLTLLGFGMANWIAFWFDYGRQVNAEELAEALVQTFLNGLLNPAK
ncbi:MAG: TetR/AcrR family transcriptional regulator [Candidatus Aminicenantes bacterium]|nr:TetR/AcrR family transcriptional regulator [Candidatus Aminicenantes bacterium]